MIIFKHIFWLLWRVWFYLLIVMAILVLFPFLLIITGSERLYRRFFIVARLWAKIILFGMGFYTKVQQAETMQPGKPYMIISNHTSMLDIMLMFHIVKQPFVFVGKKELAKFPLFGFFYSKTCILVDRKDARSRREVFNQANHKIKQGVGICIFPEGGVPDDESIVLDRFKDGAFRLAIDHELTIVPMVIHDTKKRFSYNWRSGGPGKLKVSILPFIEPPKTNDHKTRQDLRSKSFNMIKQKLTEN